MLSPPLQKLCRWSTLFHGAAGKLEQTLSQPTRMSHTESKELRGWERLLQSDGSVTVRLASWSVFFDFLESEVFHSSLTSKHTYVWRGQRRSDWSLSASLDRLFGRLNLLTLTSDKLEKRSQEHLDSFKRAARGRRGSNPRELEEMDLWALGQHFGLATPLLDWTHSPFAAAYFAFEEFASDSTPYRVVYGLDKDASQNKSVEFLNGPSLEKGRTPVLEFYEPMSDENPRLVSQDGIFTRAPIGTPVESWVAQAFEGSPTEVLLRVEIPDTDRLVCLRALKRMNIHHASLFPDLSGSSRSTNLKLELESDLQRRD